MVKVGILGAAGYTGGELIRLLINHPEAEIVFANSESNAGNLVAEVHEGLYGETDLKFTAEMTFRPGGCYLLLLRSWQERGVPEGAQCSGEREDYRPGTGLPSCPRDCGCYPAANPSRSRFCIWSSRNK